MRIFNEKFVCFTLINIRTTESPNPCSGFKPCKWFAGKQEAQTLAVVLNPASGLRESRKPKPLQWF
jgi:hypothetical protein